MSVRLWTVVAIGLVAACLRPAPGIAAELFVNKDTPVGQDDCATHGSAAAPLSTVAFAADVCARQQAQAGEDVTIFVLCAPAATDCKYDLPSGNTFKALPDGKRATIRGEPYQMVRFRQEFVGTGPSAIKIESNWTISGLVFEGAKDAFLGDAPSAAVLGAEPSGGGGFVRLAGDNIVLTHNEITNTPYICVALGSGSDLAADQFSNVEISHNHIHNCHTAKGGSDPAASIDRHCVYNRIARSVVLKFNDITGCGGDGYAIENYLIGNLVGEQPMLAEVALDNVILGNRFYTSCVAGVSWGENAVDVKRAGAGLAIRDNAIWGYREAFDKTVPCHGTGTGDIGYGVVVHGQLEEANGSEDPASGLATANGPLCTGSPRCALIEGNDISNSMAGLTIGTDGAFPLAAQGRTYGVDVRGNTIHDLRGVAYRALWERGYGIALTTHDAAAAAPFMFNRVYRNTVANIPGATFYVGSSGSEFAHSFAVRNNLVSWNGVGGAGADACTARIGTYPDDHRDNYWNDALLPPSTATKPEYSVSGLQPFRLPYAQSRQLTCGTTAEPAPPLPDPYLGLPLDYRILPGPFDDKGGTDPAFGEPYSGETELCGSAYDIGPRERCADEKRIYLRETSDPNPDRDEEIFSGVWWLSPDIGIWDDDGVTPYASVSADTPLRQDTPFFRRNGTTTARLLLRIRSANEPALTEPIHVRIWGAPFHTSISFPREFTPYVDTDVLWAPGSANLIDSGPAWRVYAFAWQVKGAKHPRYAGLEHFCVRAEISMRFDRKPPFMTPIERSNNLAQRNVAIEREPVTSPNILFRFEDGSDQFVIETKLERGRKAYLHFPETAARIWRPEQNRRVIPSGRVIALGRRTIVAARPARAGENVAQLIVDSREAGAPAPSETISVRQPGRSGIAVQLNVPGFRESFEWPLPRTWKTSGQWAVLDRGRVSCASSRLGVRAVAFTDPAGCALPRGERRRGRLVTPTFAVPRRRGTVGVTFFHWARGGRAAAREVWVESANGAVRVRRWVGRDHGRRDEFAPVYIDLRRFRGRSVRLRFTIDAGARAVAVSPGGWFIDDLALN